MHPSHVLEFGVFHAPTGVGLLGDSSQGLTKVANKGLWSRRTVGHHAAASDIWWDARRRSFSRRRFTAAGRAHRGTAPHPPRGNLLRRPLEPHAPAWILRPASARSPHRAQAETP